MTITNSNILDCTLRDGGYYTNWVFEKSLVRKYLTTLKENKIRFVEIGFKFLKQDNYIGQYGTVNEHLVDWAFKVAKNNYGLMLNASEFKNFKKAEIKKIINKNFVLKKKSSLNFIRIASHIHESEIADCIAKNLKKLGYNVFINLMQITMIKFKDFESFYYKTKNNCDVFYIADSLGNLKEKNFIKKICFFLQKERKEFGIHAHDNQGLALKNTLLFKKFGAKWLDSTILGMGRGPGNVDTIKLIKSLKQKSKGLDDVKKRFNNLKKNYRWGKNIYYSMASKKKIHPTYIQEILEYNNLSKRSIFKFINYIGKFPTHSYSNLILEEAVSSLNRGSQNLTKLNNYNLKNKDILILGSSKNLIEKYFIEIENFILKKKPLVFSLNFNKENLDKYVNFYIIGHINRIFTNDKNIKNNLNKIISSMMIETNKVNLKKLIVYPAIIKDGKFKQNKNNCILPNMLSFSYSAAICNYLKAKNIFLAGFDGYLGQKNLKKNIEMIETVKIIESSTKKNFISLTPTIYPIKTSSSNNYL